MRPLRPLTIAAAALLLVALPAAAQTPDLSGDWELEWETPNGMTRTMAFTFSHEGESIGGEVVMEMMQRELTSEIEGEIDGTKVTFTFEIEPPGRREGAGRGGRGGRGGRAGRGGGAGGTPTFSFEGALEDGELRGVLTAPRGEEIEAVIRRVESEG